MAIKLLDGSSVALDLTTTISSTSTSWKCLANRVTFDIVRTITNLTTFCNTGQFFSGKPEMMMGRLGVSGFTSTGSAASDPLYLFATTASIPFVFTADTGCTITGNVLAETHHTGMTAKANSEMAWNGTTDGSFSTAWVIV